MKKKLSKVFLFGSLMVLFFSTTSLAKEAVLSPNMIIEKNEEWDSLKETAEDSIIGVPLVSPASVDIIGPGSSECPNYAISREISCVGYKGYIQFKPSYKTQRHDGSGLQSGRHVKQAWIDYRRKNKSVIGGAKWTRAAKSSNDKTIYSASANCLDDLIDWSERATTEFWRGWVYFK